MGLHFRRGQPQDHSWSHVTLRRCLLNPPPRSGRPGQDHQRQGRIEIHIGIHSHWRAFSFGPNQIPAKPEDFEFAKTFWELTRGLLEEGKVKVHKPSVNKYGKGFEGILKGMDEMKNGNVSGEKLVFTL